MDKSDFSFMKTGTNLINTDDNMNHVEKSQLLSVMTVFMENALFIAEKLVLYEKREEITDEDIILALKSQALDHNEIWDKDETKNKLSKLYSEIYQELNSNYESSSDEETEEDLENNSKNNRILQKMTEDEYHKIKEINSRWIEWSPSDQESILIKNAINNTEKKFKKI